MYYLLKSLDAMRFVCFARGRLPRDEVLRLVPELRPFCAVKELAVYCKKVYTWVDIAHRGTNLRLHRTQLAHRRAALPFLSIRHVLRVECAEPMLAAYANLERRLASANPPTTLRRNLWTLADSVLIANDSLINLRRKIARLRRLVDGL